MTKPSPPMDVPKLKDKMRKAVYPSDRREVAHELDKHAPDDPATLYKMYKMKSGAEFFSRRTTSDEENLYGTPFVHRFYELPHTPVSTDKDAQSVLVPGGRR